MKILLIGANSVQFSDGKRWFQSRRRYAYAPTTLTTLASLIPPELDAEVRVIDEAVDELPEDFWNADIVGISAMTCDINRAYRCADEARRRGITVVLGGYHATFLPEEASMHADSVVVGFAERAWPRLLKDFASHALDKIYEASWDDLFRCGNCVPRRDLINRSRYMISDTLEATRGCPNRCGFCIIPPMHRSRYVCREIDTIGEDLDTMQGRRIAFLDSSPFENRIFSRRLFALLKERNADWFAAASLRSITDRDWVEDAAHSGCRGLLIGFESLNSASLEETGKQFNRVEQYRDVVRMLHSEGIAVLGCFVFGFDSDDISVFERTVEFVDRCRIDLVLYSAFTPIPGTDAHARLREQNRIISTEWDRYDGRHVVFSPAQMTVEQLQEGLFRAWSDTYGISSILRRVSGVSSLPFFTLAANIGFRMYKKTFLPEERAVA
jgi:radical SAM superfamily enzyme YgiQ (UPF0313 family)